MARKRPRADSCPEPLPRCAVQFRTGGGSSISGSGSGNSGTIGGTSGRFGGTGSGACNCIMVSISCARSRVVKVAGNKSEAMR